MNNKKQTGVVPVNKNGITEFAQHILDDGQNIRPFHNYLSETFDGIKNTPLSFDGVVFKDRIEFYKHLQGCLDLMIKTTEEWKSDAPAQYEQSNN
jgi:hypothetical protein